MASLKQKSLATLVLIDLPFMNTWSYLAEDKYGKSRFMTIKIVMNNGSSFKTQFL